MNIDLEQIKSDVAHALAEDVGSGDVSATLLADTLQAQAQIIAREPLLLCGQAWVEAVFHQVDANIHLQWQVAEGAWLAQPTTLCTIHGCARSILTAERTALNFLQTLSATATQTYHYVEKINSTKARLLDTRKTIPGLRYAQKYAVRCAGGLNHRMGLYDAFLIKENHITACGSITKAIALARQNPTPLFVEIEVETLAQCQEAFNARPDRILLDNFTLNELHCAVQMNQPKVCDLEASGGITADNIVAVANTGVDFISVGCITKSIQAIDLSLLIREVYET